MPSAAATKHAKGVQSQKSKTKKSANALIRALGPSHYGLNFVVRNWIYSAINRRSLPLLAKAATFTETCALNVDQILCCGENELSHYEASDSRGKMQCLRSILLKSGPREEISGDPLQFSELPLSLLQAIETERCNQERPLESLHNRWIWIREMKRGRTRFYATEAFQANVSSYSRMQETLNGNNVQPVNELWTPVSERSKYAKAFVQQFSLHKNPGMKPRPLRFPPTKIELVSQQVVETECVACMEIVSVDHAFLSIEYSPPPPDIGQLSEILKNYATLASTKRR